MLEKVERRATKMVYGFNDFMYEQILRRLNITTLETRRLRGDLIEDFKIVKGVDNVDFRNFFHLSTTGLRGHISSRYLSLLLSMMSGNTSSLIGLLIAGIVYQKK